MNDDQPIVPTATLKPWQSPILRSISLRQTESGNLASEAESLNGVAFPAS